MLGLAPFGASPVGGSADPLVVNTSLWTPPRTWVDSEVVTATMMNAHIRDNLGVIKITRDAFGRLPVLDSTTLVNLSAANLTGLAVAGGNVFTAGRTRLTQGAAVRMRVPVGTDLWAGTKGVDAAGSVWIEGDYLHHVAADQTTEYRWLGASLGAPGGALAGSIFVEGAYLHYIDASNVERYIYTVGTSGHSDALALGGSLWVETYMHGIQETGTIEYPWHADAAHTDGTVHNDNTSHSDSGPHGDSTSHGDSGGHSDFTDPYVDHNDYVHVDQGGSHDDHTDHADHSDHSDTGAHSDSNPHADHSDHSDSPAYNQPTVV